MICDNKDTLFTFTNFISAFLNNFWETSRKIKELTYAKKMDQVAHSLNWTKIMNFIVLFLFLLYWKYDEASAYSMASFVSYVQIIVIASQRETKVVLLILGKSERIWYKLPGLFWKKLNPFWETKDNYIFVSMMLLNLM